MDNPIQLSQDSCSANINNLPRLRSSLNPLVINDGDPRGNSSSSSNARRLELRNARFRAALLPSRRPSPPQTSIANLVPGKSENHEIIGDCVKTRAYLASDTPSPLNILREISNSSRRTPISRTPLGDIFGLADDEKELSTTDSTDTMVFKTGSIKSVKNRKKVKRVPSFQSAKYIEYLENELGAATQRLESLQSPETVKGQAAKIRKLERKTEELSQHLKDWEQNYEERVNDQVFERLHGESSLRLKILALEEAAIHKEAHISELGKELEETKSKLIESEAVESTLSRRVDVLTELLAKSPTRMNFSMSVSETPVPIRSTRPTLPRPPPTSPTREPYGSTSLNGFLQADEIMQSPISVTERFSYQVDEHVVETDTESLDQDTFSRPVSGIFSSRSSQTSTSRPTSIFSTNSFGAVNVLDDKPTGRPRRSRRFAPGSTGLKPLLLPATANRISQGDCFETPKKVQSDTQSENELLWDSAGELSMSTPSRPRPRRPYSWAPSSEVIPYKSILEDDESGDDTFLANNGVVDDLPAYLRQFAPRSSLKSRKSSEQDIGSSPAQTKLSLQQELDIERSYTHFSDHLSQVQESPRQEIIAEALIESAGATIKQTNSLRLSVQQIAQSSFISDDADVATRSNELQISQHGSNACQGVSCNGLPDQLRKSYLANLVMFLRQKPLGLARQILLRSWARGSTQLEGLTWWILGLLSKSRGQDAKPVTDITAKDAGLSSEIILPSSSTHSSVSSIPGFDSPSGLSSTPSKLGFSLRSGLIKILPQLQALAFTNSDGKGQHRCQHCVEPSSKQQLRLWTKLTLALLLAVGYAILEGPAVVLDPKAGDSPASEPLHPISEGGG